MPYVVMLRRRGDAEYGEDTTYPDDQAPQAAARVQAWRDAGQDAMVEHNPPDAAAAPHSPPRVGDLADATALLGRIQADLAAAERDVAPPAPPVAGL